MRLRAEPGHRELPVALQQVDFVLESQYAFAEHLTECPNCLHELLCWNSAVQFQLFVFSLDHSLEVSSNLCIVMHAAAVIGGITVSCQSA